MSDPRTPVPLTLGIDLGTSAVKVVALGLDNRVLGESASGFATISASPRQAEQNPTDWLHAASCAMSQLHSNLSRELGEKWLERVTAIGITGQLPTLVCLTDDGPLTGAVTWQDGRADAWATQKIHPERRQQIYKRTGMPIDGRYLAPMLQYHFTDRISEVRCILSAKDYLLSELIGRRLTEPSTAAGYGIYDLTQQRFNEELCEFWNLPANLLPPIAPANSLAGPLSLSGAKLLGLPAGVPVSTGAADSVCAAYAMSGLDENIVSISLGTSAIILGTTAQLRFDDRARYLLTPHVEAGWYGREMDLLATGTGYRWLSELFAWREGEVDIQAAKSVPGAHGLCFAPYLAGGEQGALWNPKLQAAIFGLNLQHSRSDIARAFLEGVFFEIRRCLEVLVETAPVEAVMVSGYIVNSSSSTQLLANILQRPVGTVLDKSPAATGAALLARRIASNSGSMPTSHSHRYSSALLTQPNSQAYGPLYENYLAKAALCA